MNQEQRQQLRKEIGRTQGYGTLDGFLNRDKCEKQEDYLSLWLHEAIDDEDSPEDVYGRIQYALGEFEAAAEAASKYGDELGLELALQEAI